MLTHFRRLALKQWNRILSLIFFFYKKKPREHSWLLVRSAQYTLHKNNPNDRNKHGLVLFNSNHILLLENRWKKNLSVTWLLSHDGSRKQKTIDDLMLWEKESCLIWQYPIQNYSSSNNDQYCSDVKWCSWNVVVVVALEIRMECLQLYYIYYTFTFVHCGTSLKRQEETRRRTTKQRVPVMTHAHSIDW